MVVLGRWRRCGIRAFSTLVKRDSQLKNMNGCTILVISSEVSHRPRTWPVAVWMTIRLNVLPMSEIR